MTRMRDAMVKALHDGVDPFRVFDPTGRQDSTDEWDSHHAWFDQCVTQLRPSVIVEVGSFLGVSSRHFAAALRREEVDGVVVCVDTWLGDHVLWNHPRWRSKLNIVNGRPEMYTTWMANMMATRLHDYVCPLPMSSTSGARYLSSRHVAAELVYIDGSHDEGDVYNDLACYWDFVLSPGGVMLIDDYAHLWPGVVRDADRFMSERRLTGQTDGMKLRLRKE